MILITGEGCSILKDIFSPCEEYLDNWIQGQSVLSNIIHTCYILCRCFLHLFGKRFSYVKSYWQQPLVHTFNQFLISASQTSVPMCVCAQSTHLTDIKSTIQFNKVHRGTIQWRRSFMQAIMTAPDCPLLVVCCHAAASVIHRRICWLTRLKT